MRTVEPRLHAALIPAIGIDFAREATAEALAWAWEHWDRVRGMDNAAGYLYRVARTKARKLYKGPRVMPAPPAAEMPWIEPALPTAIADLSERQRVVVVLVYALGWTQADVAGLLGLSHGAVQKHAERGLARLRTALGGET
ncbi:MAG: sigma-70 family RNA polymerase sigma factor [Acidimicrobiia bacterium]|nr:sigma-70 family RNA polymerase sigma factor [Acidimicrobiia bacterium]